MTDRPWTSGPWEYRPREHDDWGVVRVGDYHLCQARDPRVPYEGLQTYRDNNTDPWESNARLIAAAPDLAEALIELLQWEPTRADYDHQPEKRADRQYASDKAQFTRARAALEKAGWKP